VRWLLRVPIAGSAVLFAGGVVIYLFSVTSLGILIATLVGWFDAAVRTSGAPNLHHHEFSVRWYDADAANGLAVLYFPFSEATPCSCSCQDFRPRLVDASCRRACYRAKIR